MDMHLFSQISPERYEILLQRYKIFTKQSDDTNTEPVKVFDPLPQKLLAELELIREVSKDLQKKKDEEINKAAQAATQEAEVQKKKETESTEVQENKTP